MVSINRNFDPIDIHGAALEAREGAARLLRACTARGARSEKLRALQMTIDFSDMVIAQHAPRKVTALHTGYLRSIEGGKTEPPLEVA